MIDDVTHSVAVPNNGHSYPTACFGLGHFTSFVKDQLAGAYLGALIAPVPYTLPFGGEKILY